MKGEEFMLRVERRMMEYRFEPTREDFADWVNDEDIKAFTDERRALFQQLLAAGKSQNELIDELTGDELFGWYWHIDILIEGNIPFP